MIPDDLSQDKIDEIETELGVEYDYTLGAFVPGNGYSSSPAFPTQQDLDEAETDVEWYLEDNP